jgi:tRNA threonylcarbamoyladenosine biosynthesis protein TsaE
VEWSRVGDMLVVHSHSEAETEMLGRWLAAEVRPGCVVGMVGELGAGKTRLARAIAEALGADPGVIASPTFVLVNEYEASLPIYHFDAYRLKSVEEFEALGTDEYFAGEGLCLVEWADRVEKTLPDSAWCVFIETEASGRLLRLQLDSDSTNALAKSLESWPLESAR